MDPAEVERLRRFKQRAEAHWEAENRKENRKDQKESRMDKFLPKDPLISVVLIITVGVAVAAIFIAAAAVGAKRAEEETIQVCIKQGIDPECCRYPRTCEEHE
jgi:cytoskeletal protein RodZ